MTRRTQRIVPVASLCSRGNSGQSLVIVAIALTAMLGFMAILIDVGAGYAERRVEQNAADGAAVAGARMIALSEAKPVTGADVLAAIDSYAKANGGLLHDDDSDDDDSPHYLSGAGVDLGAITTDTIPSAAAGVLVRTEKDINTLFGHIFDEDDIDVGATAAAVFYTAAQPWENPGNLLPIGIPKSNFDEKQTWDLRDPSYGHMYSVEVGYKGLLNFKKVTGGSYTPGSKCVDKPNPPKPDLIECWCEHGWDGKLGQGSWVEFFAGDIGDNITQGIANNIKAHPNYDSKGTFGLFYVPIWDEYKPKDGGTDAQIHVVGFASFKIYLDSSTASRTVGDFVPYVIPDGSINPGGIPYGPKTIKMVTPPK